MQVGLYFMGTVLGFSNNADQCLFGPTLLPNLQLFTFHNGVSLSQYKVIG